MSQDLSSVMNGVMWMQVVLAMLFVGTRLYTRHFIIGKIGWDDIFMLVNLITFIGFVACTSVGTAYGVGKKVALIPKADYSKALMWEVIGQGICILGIAASKASVALFLLRIITARWQKMLLWICIIVTSLLCVITTILLFVQCRPAAYLWDQNIPGGYCWLNFTPIGITTGAWSAIMDFALVVLPWPVILGLNMKPKEKIVVLSGLSLGIFAGICSIIRTYELQTLSSKAEYVYDTAPMLLWSTTEILVTIICACVPILRPLYVKLRRGGSRSESSNGNGFPMNAAYRASKKLSGTFARAAGPAKAGGGASKTSDNDRIHLGLGESALRTTVKLGSEHPSEESILREQQGPSFGGGGILRTDEIVQTSSPV